LYFILARIVRAKVQKKAWSKRKAYFILTRIERAKDTRQGVEQEKVVFYSSKNSKSQGFKKRSGARESCILF
jgi:hypothetical protein